MFSKELENLIQATLEDGVLEEYEKAALVKRAQAEGVDLTEMEIYINSILQKRKRELKEKNDAIEEKHEKEKAKAIGPICPKCHKQVPPLTLVCECGYEFTKDKHESSVKQLSEKIGKIQSRPLKGKPDSDKWKADKKLREQEILDAISLFSVPNTKEDIIEFLSLAAPNSKPKGGLWGTFIGRMVILGIIAVIVFILCLIFGGNDGASHGGIFALSVVLYGGVACYLIDQDTIRYNKKARTWKAKFEQVLMKGRSLRGDSDFQRQLDYFENQMKLNNAESNKLFNIKLFG